jgi:acyl-CoA thioesterase-1
VMPAPRAEDGPPAAPPMSPPCDVPAMDIAAPTPLSNVTAALQKGEKVQILAIGSSSTLGDGRSTIRWLKDNRIDVVLVGVQYTIRLARDANYVA